MRNNHHGSRVLLRRLSALIATALLATLLTAVSLHQAPPAQAATGVRFTSGGTLVGGGWTGLTGYGGLVNRAPSMYRITTDGLLYRYLYTIRRGAFETPQAIGHGFTGLSQIITGTDVSGDGLADLLTLSRTGELRMYAGRANGAFSTRTMLSSNWTGFSLTAATSFGPNGHPMLLGVQGDRMYLYPTDGRGNLGARIALGTGWSGFTKITGIGDIDANGCGDFLAIAGDGRLVLYAGSGSSCTSFRGTTIGTGWRSFATIGASAMPAQANGILWGITSSRQLYRYSIATTTATLSHGATSPWPSTRPLPYSGTYHPQNGNIAGEMCVIPFMTTHRIHCRALPDLVAFNNAYRQQFGMNLPIDTWRYSTYRSVADQEVVKATIDAPIVAEPGTSPHGWGLAIDWYEGSAYTFGSAIHTWLRTIGPSYGWVLMPWHQEDGRYKEYWHFDYVR